MDPTIFTIVLFGCILLMTFMLYGMSSNELGDKSSKMGNMPLIYGIILAVLSIFIINNYPFGPQAETFRTLEMKSKDDLKAWGIAYGLFLVMLISFFMKLHNKDEKYSLASGVGIFGALCGLATLLIFWFIDDKIIKPSAANKYLYGQMCAICYFWHKMILLAAVGIICGAIFKTSKIIRNSCFILIACYLLSSDFMIQHMPTLMCDAKDADSWREYNRDLEKAADSIRYLKYAPLIGWVILMVSFYLQAEKDKSKQ